LFSWLRQKAVAKALSIQEAELRIWLRKLENVDNSEMAFLLAMTFHNRNHILNLFDIDLLYPDVAIVNRPMMPTQLVNTIQDLQKNNTQSYASGYFPWVFTLRACLMVELRNETRILWQHLQRGCDILSMDVGGYVDIVGERLNYRDYEKVSLGFEPKNW
jgi:hypothetical protein